MVQRRLGRFGLLNLGRRNPDETHAHASRAFTIAAQGIAYEQRRLEPGAQRTQSRLKYRRIGFLGADSLAIDHDPEQLSKPGALAAPGLLFLRTLQDRACGRMKEGRTTSMQPKLGLPRAKPQAMARRLRF